MKLLVRFLVATIVLTIPSLASGQAVGADLAVVRSSPAYAEVLLRKTEILADIEALSADYTEANPRMLDLRVETASLDRAFEKILAVKPNEAGKLTLALGKLLVRRASLETDLDRLSRNYAKDHPDVKRAKRRVEIFDAAIRQVLK